MMCNWCYSMDATGATPTPQGCVSRQKYDCVNLMSDAASILHDSHRLGFAVVKSIKMKEC